MGPVLIDRIAVPDYRDTIITLLLLFAVNGQGTSSSLSGGDGLASRSVITEGLKRRALQSCCTWS
jgi:hypothetical protein